MSDKIPPKHIIDRGISLKGEVGKLEDVPILGEAYVYWKSENDYRYLISYILKKYPNKFKFQHFAAGMGCSQTMLYEVLLGKDLTPRVKKMVDRFWSFWRLVRIKQAFKLSWVEIGVCLESQYSKAKIDKLMELSGVNSHVPVGSGSEGKPRRISRAEKAKLAEIAYKEAIKADFVNSLLGAKTTAKERQLDRKRLAQELTTRQRKKLKEMNRKNPNTYDKYAWWEYV